MDIISKPTRRGGPGPPGVESSDSESENEGQQHSDSAPNAVNDPSASKSSRKSAKAVKPNTNVKGNDVKEIQVAIKRVDDKGNQVGQGGLTSVRREMMEMIRREEEEKWEDLEYCDAEVSSSFFILTLSFLVFVIANLVRRLLD